MRLYRLLAALAILAGVALDFAALPASARFTPGGQALNLLASFSVQASLLAAAALALPALAPETPIGRRLSLPSARGAVLLFTVAVGLVHVIALRDLGDPSLLQALADAAINYAAPLLV